LPLESDDDVKLLLPTDIVSVAVILPSPTPSETAPDDADSGSDSDSDVDEAGEGGPRRKGEEESPHVLDSVTESESQSE
jgi:hypothetical protein